tara:strand:+ start:4791 stop:6413 length:1623 start_codon:yes stop_codon:yes gene_type:complete
MQQLYIGVEMKKTFILLTISFLMSANNTVENKALTEFVPYYQYNTEIAKDAFTLIWKQAMEAKAMYKKMQTRNEFISNLASTAPREEFIVNVDISPELALANPEGQVFLSTDGQNSWQSATAVPMTDPGYENTWQSIINNDGSQDVSWYVSAAVDSEPLGFDYGRIIVSQTPYNQNNAFPPTASLYATLATDDVGDAPSNQDINVLLGTYSDSKAFVSMGINGGCCDEGGFFGPWYLYGVAIVNPEAEDAVAYAIGYGDGGFGQLTPGLYKITGDLATGEVGGFELLTGNIDYNTSGNFMQASTDLNTIVNDVDWGEWPNSFEGFIALGVTVEAGLDGLDIAIELKDQTSPGLMLLTTQTQSDNVDCELSNLVFDAVTNTYNVNYIDEEGNLPWFKQFQICAIDGPCYYFGDMLAIEHNYLEGTTFSHELPEQITDSLGEVLDDGEYLAKAWFADGEVGDYQLAENIFIANGQIVGDGECANLGDINGDATLNVLDVVLTVNNVLCVNGGDCYDLCADMNQDGTLNVLDIVILIDVILNS